MRTFASEQDCSHGRDYDCRACPKMGSLVPTWAQVGRLGLVPTWEYRKAYDLLNNVGGSVQAERGPLCQSRSRQVSSVFRLIHHGSRVSLAFSTLQI